MAYIGAVPTAVPLTGADIEDGTIGVADLSSTLDLSSKTVTLPSGVGGKVLQVAQSVNTTERTTTSTSFVDVTGLSVSITPSSTSNKVLILCNFNGESLTSAASSQYTILRGSTNLASSSFCGVYVNADNLSIPCSICFLDSPSTTSATTYKLQFRRSNSSGGDTKVNSNDSTITVMEIAG